MNAIIYFQMRFAVPINKFRFSIGFLVNSVEIQREEDSFVWQWGQEWKELNIGFVSQWREEAFRTYP